MAAKQNGIVRQGIAALFFTGPRLAIAIITVVSLLGPASGAAASPDDVLLEVDRATRLARAERERNRDVSFDPQQAFVTATLLRDEYRETHDPRLLGQAMSLVKPQLDQSKISLESNLLYADLLQAGHQFDEAIDVLQTIAKQFPQDTRIWNQLAGIYLATGQYRAGRNACARLLTLARPLVSAGCAAQVAGLTGHAQNAFSTLHKTLNRESGETEAVRAWAEGILAEQAWRLGDIDIADWHYAQSVQLAARNLTLRIDYAMFLAMTDQAERAIELSGNDTALALPRAIALTRLDRDASADIAVLNNLFETAALRGDNGHAREAAWFALVVTKDYAQALELAKENWIKQREPVDQWLLAQVAHAANEPTALTVVRDWTESTGLEDSRVERLLRAAL